MINGKIDNIKASTLQLLDNYINTNVEVEETIYRHFLEEIAAISTHINKEISAHITRSGVVLSVTIGDSNSVVLPQIDQYVTKLSSSKIIHTHPSGNSNLSGADLSALASSHLDAMIAIGVVNGQITDTSFAILDFENEQLFPTIYENISLNNFVNFNFKEKCIQTEKKLHKSHFHTFEQNRVILVGAESQELLDELSELARACQFDVVAQVLQKLRKVERATFIGSGKVKEIAMLRQLKNANKIIFDDELSGIQIKNLEQQLGCEVIDRTMLILEIFSKRARTNEAKLQVQLAITKYQSTHLTGLGNQMSRQGGGMNAKGSGEQKLELDRRLIRDRIHDIQSRLMHIQQSYDQKRNKRQQANIPNLALVGYTNVGKSTLRNLLCATDQPDKSVLAKDMLFATLESTTRTLILPNHMKTTLSDTVGFIRKLPHDLVESFKSTLNEVVMADIIIHVIDASSPEATSQLNTVKQILSEIGAENKQTIYVLNKIDIADENNIFQIREALKHETIVEISAKKTQNIDQLLQTITNQVQSNFIGMKITFTYDQQQQINELRNIGVITNISYLNDIIEIEAKVPQTYVHKYNKQENDDENY